MSHTRSAIDFKAVFESLPGQYVVLAPDAPDFPVVAVSNSFLRVTNTQKENVLGRGIFAALPDNPEDPKASGVRNVRAAIDTVLHTGTPLPMAVQRYDLRGAGQTFYERYWSQLITPVTNELGEVTALLFRWEDVTDFVRGKRDQPVDEVDASERMEADLLRLAHEIQDINRELASSHQVLADSIPQLVWMANADGWIFWYNQRWYSYTGTTPDQMRGWGWQAVHDPAMLPAVMENWQRSIATGEAFSMEFPLLGADGSFRWFLTRVTPVRNHEGKITRWFGTNTDIDELRSAQEALRESEARFRVAADGAPVMIWVSAPDGLCTWFNKPWLQFTGRGMEQELGNGWSDSMHREDLDRCLDLYARSFDRRAPFVMEYRMLRHDGEWRWILNHGVPRYGSDDEFLGYIGSCLDIHDRKQVEEELRRANTDLEQFAYSASHDLREPLRNVSTYAQLLHRDYESVLDANGQDYLKFVSGGAKRMDKLVQDLLRYTQTMSASEGPIRLVESATALNRAIADLKLAIQQSVAVIQIGGMPAVRMQEVHLEQLFRNLLSNAIKYRSGERPLRIEISGEIKNREVVFSVADNGMGIDARYHDRVFGIFKRLHSSEYTGTGIGLAICKRLVERYGGRIWVESELEKGAKFLFAIPNV